MRRAAATGERFVDYYAIVVDGRAAGVIETYLVADHPEWDEVVQVGPDAAGVDLFIGELDLVGRGLGAEVLRAFVREVVFARPETTAAVATVEEANSRSWRAFERRASATSGTSGRTASRTASCSSTGPRDGARATSVSLRPSVLGFARGGLRELWA